MSLLSKAVNLPLHRENPTSLKPRYSILPIERNSLKRPLDVASVQYLCVFVYWRLVFNLFLTLSVIIR